MTELGFASQLAEDLSTEDLRLVLSVFRTDVQRLTGSLADAVSAGDGTAFRRAAHALAGAAGAVGADGLESACRRAMAQDGDPGALLAQMRHVADAAMVEVTKILSRLDGRP